MINWDVVGIVGGLVVSSTGGLYVAIRNWAVDTRDEVSAALDHLRADLSTRLDELHADYSSLSGRVLDQGERLGRVEGALGIAVLPAVRAHHGQKTAPPP